MSRRVLVVSSLLIASALTCAAAMRAVSPSRELQSSENSQRDDRSRGQVYDQSHRDWHDWDDSEERAYRQFLTETRKDYREFTRLNARQQSEYWNWRHSHPDRDDRGARSPGRFYDENGRDWHNWNESEDRAYREYLTENRKEYREFSQLNAYDQQNYWVWRHANPDRTLNILTGGPKRYYDQNGGQWHEWNDNEERAYHRYLDESRRPYVDFDHAEPGFQLQFWVWRRGHPDQDDRNFKRYFDPGHNDWHVWDQNEDRAYREFMNGRHWYYRELTELNAKDQQRYFDWRHQHPDKDRDHH